MEDSDITSHGAATETENDASTSKQKTQKRSKQIKTETPNSALGAGASTLKSLPEVRFTSNQAETSAGATNKPKKNRTPAILVNSPAARGSVPVSRSSISVAKTKTPRKMKNVAPSAGAVKKAAADAPPERATVRESSSHGRVVASRYKGAARSRAVSVPSKEESCISINQSDLFATAAASTPNSTAKMGKSHDGSTHQKPPPKMGSLPNADKADRQKVIKKMKEASKIATVKVKPMRALDATKAQVGGDTDQLSDHEILYNQYLQWQYLCRMTEKSSREETPVLNLQARQLSQLVERERQENLELERKLQAVTLYRDMVQLERDVGHALSTVNASADSARGDLSRLTTTLDATRNRLQLKCFTEPTDGSRLMDDLLRVAEQSRDGIDALNDATAPDANLLRHTAQSLQRLQQALHNGMHDMTRSSEMLGELTSLSLYEASLVVGCQGS